MDKYKNIIERLTSKEVVFENGMSQSEIDDTEKLYNITIPIELTYLYALALPVSDGFYNWRDRSNDNIEKIKRALEAPIIGLQSSLKNEFQRSSDPFQDFWYEGWGEKPRDFKTACEVLLKRYNDAPKLVPIYSHRYMPCIKDNTRLPVFSLMESDIICYGENLIAYFEIEFGFKKYSDMSECQYVEFWSDLL